MTTPLRILCSLCYDQLNSEDRKSKQSEKLKPAEDTVASSWEECRETNSNHSLPPHLQAAVIAIGEITKIAIGEITKIASMSREEREASMKGFSQAPKRRGGGYQPIGGSEATPPKDE